MSGPGALSAPAETRLLLVKELPADLTTPVAILRTLLQSPEPCFLLESVEGGERAGRWSFLGTAPSAEITADPFRRLKSIPRGGPAPETRVFGSLSAGAPDLPPFTGGAVGFVGYDAVRRLERLPVTKPDPVGFPETWFGVFDELIAFDHVKHRLLLVANASSGEEVAARARLERLARLVTLPPEPLPPAAGATEKVRPGGPGVGASCAAMVRPAGPGVGASGAAGEVAFTESMPRASYVEAVQRAQEHILAGDIFQVVLSRRWSAPFPGDPLGVYRALRRISPSPYQYFLRTPHGVVFGASPERLVAVTRRGEGAEGAEVETIPLAGTRPRGRTPEEDLAHEAELLADPKERAEHVMLVDLGRNDLGRVSVPGSVRPRELFRVERYSHVMHLASRVTGTLAPGRDAADALAAAFPAGTLTGAPKIRAMEIIEELEPVRRGPYGGAVGYLDFSGNLDVAIAIRTAVVRDGVLHVQAGAGLVADSDPEREADECESKARALMRAVAAAKEYPS